MLLIIVRRAKNIILKDGSPHPTRACSAAFSWHYIRDLWRWVAPPVGLKLITIKGHTVTLNDLEALQAMM